MKKVVIGIVSLLLVGGLVAFLIINNNAKQRKEIEVPQNNVEKKETEGYEIKVSKKNITLEKGKSTSFVITFTNPDPSSIREYIHCEDQSDIVLVRYSDYIDGKITVEVEGLKVGTTEIEISDYEYPETKEVVKVNVVDKK